MKKVLLLLLFVTVSNSYAQDPKNLFSYIAPSDSRIQYTGRINFSNPNAPIFYWPGTYAKAKFQGTSLLIQLEDEKGENFYNVFIDDSLTHPTIIDCDSNIKDYTVAENLQDGEHTVWLFRRTEGFSGPTTFLGFVLDVDKKLLPLPPKPKRKIEFYGDSITCGMGNECEDDEEDDDNSKHNNFLAYGAITARNLNAEYHCIARSGIGLMISWFELTMPDYYYRLDPSDVTSRWDFSRWIPDVVVLNLFQNDSWLIDRLDPRPGETEIVAAYMEFLQTIRQHYPEAHIFCTLGSMDATRAGSPWPGYITSAAEKFRRENNDEKIYTYFFEFDGWSKHPRVRHHRKNADELTAFIKEKMDW